MDNQEILNIITYIFSNENNFLTQIYGISSYEDGINYLNNNINMKESTKIRILNCLFKIHLKEDYFPSKEYIEHLQSFYYNTYNIKLKKSGLKNILINNKYDEINKYDILIYLIIDNLKNIIEE